MREEYLVTKLFQLKLSLSKITVMPYPIATLAVILSFVISAHAANYYSIRNQLISARRRRNDQKIKTLFEEWMSMRGKIYHEIGEKDRRFEVFKDNLRFVDEHNGNDGNQTYRLGLNKFADLTNEEYRAAYLKRADPGSGIQRHGSRAVDGLPECVDGSEGTLDGGYEDGPQNEKALQKASTHRPICAAIEASGRAFQLYSSGVFTGECGTYLDHGVVVVGYGSKYDVDYWIVKNSWGTDWGENGYLKLERNVGSPGKCGIVMEASSLMKNGENPTNSQMANGYHAAE